MRILIITPEYPPHHIGGGGIAASSLVKYLIKKNAEVHVLSGYYKTHGLFDSIRIEKKKNFKLTWLPLLPTFRSNFPLQTYMPPNLFSLYILFKKIFFEKYDLIHIYAYGHFLSEISAFLCFLRRKKFILTVHGFPKSPKDSTSLWKIFHYFYFNIFSKISFHAKKIIVVSSTILKECKRRGIKGDIKVIPPDGIETFSTSFNSKIFRKKYGIKQNEIFILTIGTLRKIKGIQDLIKAMPLILKEYKNAKLVIAGKDVGYGNQLKKIVKKMKLEDKVIFTGHLEGLEKKMAIKEANIFVIPSHFESFCLAALDGISFGKPIVATRVGGIKDIFKNKINAILVKPKNPKELAKGILELLKNDKLRKTISKNVVELVKKFKKEEVMESIYKVYKEVID